jgi:hypothetical protein
MLRVERYSESQKVVWDNFTRKSKNGTFLFLRDYMDYHSDRFQDHSLFIRDEKERLIALLPANQQQETMVSHGGLTYGGFITDDRMKTPKMLEVFESTLSYLQRESFRRLVYKTVPYIYHRFPAEEDRYALFLSNAILIRRGVLAVICSDERLSFQERRIRGVKKAMRDGLFVKQSDDFQSYWQILTSRLLKAHNARPVHSLEEIELLRSRFPDNIRLFGCFKDSTMLAGVVVYETERVARAQYIAASEHGQEIGALDLVFSELLTKYYASKPFFDFGTSDEENGRYLNRGLIDQKEAFGGRAVVHDHYEIGIADWKQGQLMEAMEWG